MRGLVLILLSSLTLSVPSLAEDGKDVSATASEQVAVDPRSPSEIRSDQLDTLFARLYLSKGEGGTQLIEKKIWDLWMASDSPTAEALLQQSTKAMNDGAPKESLSILNRLIGTYPDFAEAWNKRATLYFLMKRDDEALLDIQRVLELEPRHFGALSGRGLILQRRKDYGGAKEAFSRALRLNPGLEDVRAALKALDRLEQGI